MDMYFQRIFLGQLASVSAICKGAVRTGGPEKRVEPGTTFKMGSGCGNRNQFATYAEKLKNGPRYTNVIIQGGSFRGEDPFGGARPEGRLVKD